MTTFLRSFGSVTHKSGVGSSCRSNVASSPHEKTQKKKKKEGILGVVSSPPKVGLKSASDFKAKAAVKGRQLG